MTLAHPKRKIQKKKVLAESKAKKKKTPKQLTDNERLQELLRLITKKKRVSVAWLSDYFDISKSLVVSLAKKLNRRGYNISFTTGEGRSKYVQIERSEEGEFRNDIINIREEGNTIRIGFIAEPRYGTFQCQNSLNHWIYKEIFEKLGVNFVVVAGGLIAGKPIPTIKPDLFLENPEEVANYVIKHFPKSKKFKTYIVAGRKDLSFQVKDSFNIMNTICEDRDDLAHAGALETVFDVRGIKIKVMSPYDDNSPKGVSYGPQKNAETAADAEEKVNIFVFGGTHERSEIPDYGPDNCLLVTVPSLHTQMKRQARKGVKPKLGCTIIELNFKEKGEGWDIDLAKDVEVRHFNLDNYAVGNDWSVTFDDFKDLGLSEKEATVVKWFIMERSISAGELSRRLEISKNEVKSFMAGISEKYPILSIYFNQVSKRYDFPQILKTKFQPLPMKYEDVFIPMTKEVSMACTHFGSKQDMPPIVEKAFQDAIASGVRAIFIAGDITEGPGASGYRGHQFDVKCPTLDELEDYTISKFPKAKLTVDPAHPITKTLLRYDNEGKPYYEETVMKEGETYVPVYIINGNHDAWANNSVGHSIARTLAMRMPERVCYIGSRDGTITQQGSRVVDGVYHLLIHGSGGIGYTMSQKLQKFVSAMRRKKEGVGLPRVLHAGNWHIAYLLFQEELAMLAACFKYGDEFHETHGLVSWIGMYVVEVFADKKGNLTQVIAGYKNYRQHALSLKENK